MAPRGGLSISNLMEERRGPVPHRAAHKTMPISYVFCGVFIGEEHASDHVRCRVLRVRDKCGAWLCSH